MGSKNCGGSQRLRNLARQLRLYNKPLIPVDDSDGNLTEETKAQESDLNTESQTNRMAVQAETRWVRPSRAAVLICIFEGEEDDFRVILTKRSSTLSTHSGEVALPGGKADEGDADDINTALREANEEIGLDPSLVDIVAVLESFTTKRGITVVPVVGLLYDKNTFNPVPNAAEVEAIFDVPLEMFLKDENRRAEQLEWMGDAYLLHFFDYEAENEKKYVIWALTAGILIRTASIVYNRPPAFLERRPKFWNRSRQ